jgi:cell wall-associated NlpC family hydrolase
MVGKNRRISFLLVVLVSMLSSLPISAAGHEGTFNEIRLYVVAKSSSYMGIAYHFGGEDARGLDCSGFVGAVFDDLIPDLPRRSKDLFRVGVEVTMDELLPGDLVFFNTTGVNPSHVGIYIGNNHFIHSASAGDLTGVIISSLSKEYYRTRYSGAKRILHLIQND